MVSVSVSVTVSYGRRDRSSCWAVRSPGPTRWGGIPGHRLKDAVDDVNRGVVGLRCRTRPPAPPLIVNSWPLPAMVSLSPCSVVCSPASASGATVPGTMWYVSSVVNVHADRPVRHRAPLGRVGERIVSRCSDLLGTVQRVREPAVSTAVTSTSSTGFSAAAVTMGRVAMLARLPGPSAGMAAQADPNAPVTAGAAANGSRRAWVTPSSMSGFRSSPLLARPVRHQCSR